MPAAPSEHVVAVPIVQLHESPTNPRKVFPDQEELAASIRELGVTSPIVARPRKAGGYEICFGHRRVRAAAAAGLEVVPCIIRDLDDRALQQQQLVENIQRADITPIEEADAYARLMKDGMTGEEIGGHIGKTKAWVYARVKLARLGAQARTALAAGRIETSVGVLLARLPPAVQDLAIVELINQPMTYKEVLAFVRRELARPLKKAPFSVDDAKLVPKAGACTACPKNSANDPESAGDFGADVCTDVSCWSDKIGALYKLRLGAARKAGGGELPSEARANLTVYGDGEIHLYGKESIDTVVDLPDGRETTVRALLLEHRVPHKPLVTRVEDLIVEVVPEDVVNKALVKAGVKKSAADSEAEWKARQAKQAAAQAEKEKARLGVLEQLAVAIEDAEDLTWVWERVYRSASWHVPKKLQRCSLRTRAILALIAHDANNSPQVLVEAKKAFGVKDPAPGPVANGPAKKGSRK